MKSLLVATGNSGKMRELEHLLSGMVEKLYSLKDFPDMPAVVEDGDTFLENATKKALHAAKYSGMPSIADDSGLVVDALSGQPGVYSARYAGEHATDDANNAKLLHELTAVPKEKRTASFQCVISFCLPDGNENSFTGKLAGEILEIPVGDDGFGYDPLFLIPELGKTLAEIPVEQKNSISHRAKAFAEFKEHLKKNETHPDQELE